MTTEMSAAMRWCPALETVVSRTDRVTWVLGASPHMVHFIIVRKTSSSGCEQ